jgi:hypothetical protein
VSAVLATMLAGGACYKPNITSGGLSCGAANACPDGFRCDLTRTPPACVSGNLGAAGGGGAAGKAGAGGSATGGQTGSGGQIGTGGKGGAGGAACLPPVPGCTPGDAGVCDPVCNTGCPRCDQKCSVSTAGELICNPLNPPGDQIGVLGLCTQSMATGVTSSQSDNCEPGSACIMHNACGARCYRFCRTGSDCPAGSPCSIDAGAGQSFCDVPAVNCDPVNGVATNPATSGCSGSNLQACYISGETGLTVCDCYQTGLSQGQACTRSRDCFGGLVCTDPFGGGTKRCYKVCRLPAADGGATQSTPGERDCNVPNTCTPILLGNGTQTTVYGVCPELS